MDKIDKYFEKIEEKLKKSFSGIKEDIVNIKESINAINENSKENKSDFEKDKESLKQEIKQLKEKKEKSIQKDTEKLEKNIIELTNYVSELKNDVQYLKNNQEKQNDVKNLIEFNELKSQISDLKDSIENIKFPEQKDNSKEFFEIAKKLGSEIEILRKEVKEIKIPFQKDYSEDINELAKEIGEIKGSWINKKYLDKELSRTKQNIDDEITELEEKQREIENSIEQKTKSPLIFALKNEVKELKKQIEEETEKYEGFLSKIKTENKRLREDIKSENEELKNEISLLKGRITRLYSVTPEERKEIVKEERLTEETKKIVFKSLKIAIIIIPLLLIGFIFYSNFIASHDFNYFYDIGSQQDANKPYLTPLNRVSDIEKQENIDFRNIISSLTYLEVPIPPGSINLTMEVRFKNNFPNKSSMKIGASLSQEWNYTSDTVFNNSPNEYTGNGEWIIASTTFNLKDLYINQDKLSMLINIPHLANDKNQTNMQYIPVDWINITIHKNGIFEKN